ncbi:hypothetical protein [Barnesiella intestinihominis]|uniref:hypothetical protein n=1 Tax=Barnesiella intestinihominis TaxID=487174 RepID=UPI003967D17C
MVFDVDMVGRRLVTTHIDGVLLVIFIDGLLEFLLGQRIVFVRHADIPKDILVACLGRQGVVGKLRVVVIGPDGDDLELPGVAVVVDLEVIGAVGFFSEPGQFRTFLKGYPFDLPGQLVIVRVEIEGVVFKIEYRKGVALLVLRLFLPHRAHRTDTLGVNAGESLGFVVVPYAVLVDIHIDVFHAAGQLQTGVAVFLRVDVSGAAHRVEPGVELGVVGHVAAQREQPLAVGQRHLLALLAAADIDGLPLDPPFGAVSDLLGHLFERLVAILSEIVDDDVVGALHRAHLPVAGTHAVVYTFHDQGDMVPRRGGQGEDRLVVPVRVVDNKEAFYKAFDAVELDIVLPFDRRHLLGVIPFHEPVLPAHELGIVVDFERHVFVERERQAERIVALQLHLLRRVVVAGNLCLRHAVAAVYRDHLTLVLRSF